MKKIIMSLVLLLCASSCRSWEIANNPDRYISLGLDYDYQRLSGSGGVNFYPGSQFSLPQQKISQDNMSVISDFRMPILSWLTINIGGGFLSSSLKNDNFVTPLGTFPFNEYQHGYDLHVGTRIYFK